MTRLSAPVISPRPRLSQVPFWYPYLRRDQTGRFPLQTLFIDAALEAAAAMRSGLLRVAGLGQPRAFHQHVGWH